MDEVKYENEATIQILESSLLGSVFSQRGTHILLHLVRVVCWEEYYVKKGGVAY